MASITPHKKGWRVQISVKGERASAVLTTKAEAKAWAAERESEIRRMVTSGVNTSKLVSDAFNRYAEEVSPHKRGQKWEATRLAFLAKQSIDGVTLGAMRLCDVTPDTLGQWRDARLKEVKGSTINRDFALLSHVFATARREWKWITDSPSAEVRRPSDPAPRDRRISQDEIDTICLALGYDGEVGNKSSAVGAAFMFALETAMRAGEICGLTWDKISGKVANLPRTKNGSKRQVPLSRKAVEILATLPRGDDDSPCFGLTSAQLDALFRKARNRTTIEGLTFHDTRHEAITRLAQKLEVLELARMVGHKDLRNLMIYYNATAEELADKL